MGLTSYLQRSVEDPRRPLTDSSLISLLGGQPTHSGVQINERTAVRFIAIYRAVSIVSGAIASLPLVAKRGTEVVGSRLLANPHPDLTAFELWERIFWHQLLRGDAYSLKLRDRSRAITYLDPYEMGTVSARRVKRTDRNPWGKEFDVRSDDRGWPKVLTPEDVLHIPGPGYDGAEGLSPIGVARQGIGMGLAAEEHGARLFGQGTMLGGVLQVEQKLEQGEADRLKARWRAKFTGVGHAHDIAVLDAGAKYVPFGMKPADAQYVETRKFQNTDIARLYGIPPHLLADVEKSTSWGTGIEQQQIGLVVFTLMPWMTRAEQRIAKECLPAGTTADFDETGLLRGDSKAQMDAIGQSVGWGLRNRNEGRRMLGMGPVDGGDRFLVPAAHQILDDDGLPIATTGEAPAPAPGPEPDDDEVDPEVDPDDEEIE